MEKFTLKRPMFSFEQKFTILNANGTNYIHNCKIIEKVEEKCDCYKLLLEFKNGCLKSNIRIGLDKSPFKNKFGYTIDPYTAIDSIYKVWLSRCLLVEAAKNYNKMISFNEKISSD